MKQANFWKNKKVLVTGHTGFKGSWLSLWLHTLKSKVYGYSLEPPTKKNIYKIANIKKIIKKEKISNINNYNTLKKFIDSNKIEIIFHLAAQSLVRRSYENPFQTIRSNTMGTASILECIRNCKSVKTAIIVTTDKVYKNSKVKNFYKETDSLGGREVYCSSKAAAELLVESYSDSFFSTEKNNYKYIATVRAGNVIGGGDWAKDRLVPDCINAFSRNKPIKIRNPNFTRPWQHVLEPLSGYLLLAEKLHRQYKKPKFSSWNFGPNKTQHAQVKKLIDLLSKFWEGDTRVFKSIKSRSKLYETKDLFLNSFKAKRYLNWKTKWDLKKSVQMTTEWYLAEKNGLNMYKFSLNQLRDYEKEK